MTHLVVIDPGTRDSSRPIRTVDIDTGFVETDLISVALPDFPLPKINTAASYIDFTSNSIGDFDVGPTASVAFSVSNPALVNGDSELRFPRSLLTTAAPTLDKSAITGVRFRIAATVNCTFRALAVRLLAVDWEYPPIDFENLHTRLVRPVSLNGEASPTLVFPTSVVTGSPPDWPILWRAGIPSSSQDPQPIDASFQAAFNTGSIVAADPNHFSLYFRGIALDQQTQLDLDGQSQGALEALGRQPDTDLARFTNRTQEDLDLEDQERLDADSQFDLERLPDYASEDWLEVRLEWDSGGNKLQILNATDTERVLNGDPPLTGYTFTDFSLDANNNYLLLADLEEHSIRVRIWLLTEAGEFTTTLAFDTTLIVDESLIQRRKGRFGWWADLQDGDAYIKNIRPRGLNYGEVVTHPLYSNTPVDGASLDYGGSTNRILFNGIPRMVFGGSGTADPTKTKSGNAYKIVASANQPLQGIETGPFTVDDLNELEIEFDVLFPSYANQSGGELEAFLYGEFGRIVPLDLGSLVTDRWHTVHLRPKTSRFQAGDFILIVVQTLATVDTTWWVDNFNIRERMFTWEGRGKKASAWNLEGKQWVPFKDTANHLQGGILFKERGNSLQVRGQARRQVSFINDIKTTPRYSNPGNFYWSDAHPTIATTPTAVISAPTITDRRVTFDGTTSTNVGGTNIAYHWTFGDGTEDYGPSLVHDYLMADTYTVSLTVIDSQDNRNTATTTVTVS